MREAKKRKIYSPEFKAKVGHADHAPSMCRFLALRFSTIDEVDDMTRAKTSERERVFVAQSMKTGTRE